MGYDNSNGCLTSRLLKFNGNVELVLDEILNDCNNVSTA